MSGSTGGVNDAETTLPKHKALEAACILQDTIPLRNRGSNVVELGKLSSNVYEFGGREVSSEDETLELSCGR
jgi:hypothetical protein